MAGVYPGYNGTPNFTGDEIFLADADQAQTAALPETVAVSARMVAGSTRSTSRNALIGGDFGSNPWQRGTTFSSIANTVTYTADRWFAVAGGAGASITVSRVAVPSVPGVNFGARVQRAAANADVTSIAFGQAMTTARSRRFQGRQVTLSFYAYGGVSFSALGGLLNVAVSTGTGTDQTSAALAAGTWTNAATSQLYIPSPGVLSYGNNGVNNPGVISFGTNTGGNPTTGITGGTVLTPVVGVALTNERTRYQLTCTIPANATQIGVVFSYTPVGTAGANDHFNLDSIQFEEVSAAYPYATPFEIRPADQVLLDCLPFYFRLNERATVAAVQGNGMMSATNVQTVAIPTPLPMRNVPTVTVNAGTFRFNIAGTLTAVGGGFAAGAAATQSLSMINVVGAVTATAGQATQLVSGAATWGGYIEASAEL